MVYLKNIIIYLFIIIIIINPITLINVQNSSNITNHQSKNFLTLFNSKDLTPHEPIMILGDDDFTPENGVVAGNGTLDNPYIIEGWEINTNNESYGIYIENTTSYFIIRNCKIYGDSEYKIILKNVLNAIIINNNINVNDSNIKYETSISVVNSSNIIIKQNKIDTIMGKLIDNENDNGVSVVNSSNIIIEQNNINVSAYSVSVVNSSDIIIKQNNINTFGTIIPMDAPLNYYINIYIFNSSDIFIIKNNISGGYINIFNTSQLYVENNNIRLNNSILIINSNTIIIRQNNITSVGITIDIFGSSNIFIDKNNIINKIFISWFEIIGISIDIVLSSNISIRQNYIYSNYDSIITINASHVYIKGNIILNSYKSNIGVKLINTYLSYIIYNSIINYSIGLYLENSFNNYIYNNNFINNSLNVYSINSSNIWNAEYPVGGNYWSDFNCTDLYSGPMQDQIGSDGICDIPYPIYDYSINKKQYDYYPLAKPYDINKSDQFSNITVNIYSEYAGVFYSGMEINNTFYIEILTNNTSNVSVNKVLGFINKYKLDFQYNESLGMWVFTFNMGQLEPGNHTLIVNIWLLNGLVISKEYVVKIIDPPYLVKYTLNNEVIYKSSKYDVKYSIKLRVLENMNLKFNKHYEWIISLEIGWKPFRFDVPTEYINGEWNLAPLYLSSIIKLSSNNSISITGEIRKEFEAEIIVVKLKGEGYFSATGAWIINWESNSVNLTYIELTSGLSIAGSRVLPTPLGVDVPVVGNVGVTVMVTADIGGELRLVFIPVYNETEYLFDILPMKVSEAEGIIKGSLILSGQVGVKIDVSSGIGLFVGLAGLLGMGVFLQPSDDVMKGGGIVGRLDVFAALYYIIGRSTYSYTLLGPGIIYTWGNLTSDDIDYLMSMTSALEDIGSLLDWVNGSWSGYIYENFSIGGDYSAINYNGELYVYYTYVLSNGSSWINGVKFINRDMINLPNPDIKGLGVASPYLFIDENGSLSMIYAVVPIGLDISKIDLSNLTVILQKTIWNNINNTWNNPINITNNGTALSYISDGKYIYVIYSNGFNYNLTELRIYDLKGELLYSIKYPNMVRILYAKDMDVYIVLLNGSKIRITPSSIYVLHNIKSIGILDTHNLRYIIFYNNTLLLYNNTYKFRLQLPDTALDAKPLIINNKLYIITVEGNGTSIYTYKNTTKLELIKHYTLYNITTVKIVNSDNYIYILPLKIDSVLNLTGDLALFIYLLNESIIEHTINLKQGWNYIGLSIEPLNTSLDMIFNVDGVRQVYWFYNGTWLYWIKGNPNNTLKEIHAGMGLLVYCEADTNITIKGILIDDYRYILTPGWNLISSLELTSISATEFANKINASQIYYYNLSTGEVLYYIKNNIFNTLYEIEPFKVYMVYIDYQNSINMPILTRPIDYIVTNLDQ